MKLIAFDRVASFRWMLVPSILASSVGLAACATEPAPAEAPGSASQAVRDLTVDEELSDFDDVVKAFRNLYAPLGRKEARYHFKFEDLVKEYRARIEASHSEAEYVGIVQEFVSRFHDAHVGFFHEIYSDEAHAFSLPFSAEPVDDTFVITKSSTSALQAGDELLSIDGVPAKALVEKFSRYVGAPNPRTVRFEATVLLSHRAIYVSEGIKNKDAASLRVRNAAGEERDVALSWAEDVLFSVEPTEDGVAAVLRNGKKIVVPEAGHGTGGALALAHSTPLEKGEVLGNREPYFLSQQVKDTFRFHEVSPSAAALSRVGLADWAAAITNYYAATYSIKDASGQDKRILFVRIPDFTPALPAFGPKYVKALFIDQQATADALVIDETRNGGGYAGLPSDYASLLTPSPVRTYLQRDHADRQWINSFLKSGELDSARKVDAAYSANQPLTVPLELGSPATVQPADSGWTKPFLVLTDELSYSAADFFPATLKVNHIGRLFGQTTAGAGGNVEIGAKLNNSGAYLRLTRGIGVAYDPTGKYEDEEASIIEDNGVAPDTVYSNTLADVRAGYVGYVRAFNDDLLKNVLSK